MVNNLLLPLELKAFRENMIYRMEEESLHMPIAKVIFKDTDSTEYTLTSCSDFEVRTDRDNSLTEFSLTVCQAELWNIRTTSYADLLKPDIRKRVELYFGEWVSGAWSYVLMFTGIPTLTPESYSRGGISSIKIKGKNLAYLLQRLAGTYSSTSYTGYSQDLIEYWCGQAGISYNLSYNDTVYFDAVAVAYTNALMGLLDILEVLGPDVQCYFSAAGQLVIRDVPWWTEEVNEYDFDEDVILEFSRYAEPGKIHTVAEVLGNTSSAASTVEASSSIQDVYGENKKTLSSGLVTSESQAEDLAYSILRHGERHMDMAKVKIALNPYINIGSLLTVKDGSLSGTERSNFRVDTIRHSYHAGQRQETAMTGFLNESSSSSSSSSISTSSSCSSRSSSSLSSSSSSSISSSSSSSISSSSSSSYSSG